MTEYNFELHKEAKEIFDEIIKIIDDKSSVAVWQALAQVFVATDLQVNIEHGDYSAFDQYLKFLAELRKSKIADIYGKNFLKDKGESSVDTVYT